jgi:protein-S-isoprenylcysteine O-methyltransferase Ste14
MASQPKEPPKADSSYKSFDLVNRGVKRANPLGSTIFVGLRALDPLLQYGILAHGVGSSLLHKVGLETLPAGPPNTGTFVDALGLSPYRLILLAMSVGTSAKHIYWLLGLTQDELPPAAAATVGAYNLVANSIDTLLFTCVATSASLSGDFPQAPLLVGGTLYVAGMVVETLAELQRKKFKQDPRNAGKPFTGGLWSVVRHANYTGYAIWRAGFACAAAGWGVGAFVFAYHAVDFNQRAIPALDEYCAKKVRVFHTSSFRAC